MATLLPSIRNSFSLSCSTIGGEKSKHRGKLANECQRYLFLIQSQLVGFGVNPHDSSTGHSESSIHPHMAPTRGLKLMSHRLHPIHKGLLFGLYTTAFKFVSCPLFFFFNGWDSILKFWVFALLAKSEEVNIMVKIRRLSRSSLLLPMGGYSRWATVSTPPSCLSDLISIYFVPLAPECIWFCYLWHCPMYLRGNRGVERVNHPALTVSCVDLHGILCSHIDIPARL